MNLSSRIKRLEQQMNHSDKKGTLTLIWACGATTTQPLEQSVAAIKKDKHNIIRLGAPQRWAL